MECKVCCAAIYSKRSEYCIACSSVVTIQQEFIDSWSDTRLRSIGADIALSAARSIRALRIYGRASSSSQAVEAPANDSGKAPLPRRTAKEKAHKRTTPPRTQVKEPPAAEAQRENRGRRDERGASSSGALDKPKNKERPRSSSYYTSSSEEFEVKDLTGAQKTGGEEKRLSGATPKRSSEAARPIQAPDAGTEEDKALRKQEYLEAQKHIIRLREAPKEVQKNRLPENLLEVKGEPSDSLQEEKKSKRRRRDSHGGTGTHR